jgi:hypothetical protein
MVRGAIAPAAGASADEDELDREGHQQGDPAQEREDDELPRAHDGGGQSAAVVGIGASR